MSELQFLQENMNRLKKIESEVETPVRVRDEDMDTTQNSNVKWFETAIQNTRKVESMTSVID